MDKLSNKLKLVRSQSMGVGMGGGGDKVPRPELRPRAGTNEHGRQASIVLLDERRLEMHIQPRLYAGELLDLVASHIQLKEKEYFGLAVVDDNGSYTWLQLDRKILDHDLPRKPNVLQIHFLVKFFIESICHLAENKTIELFYLQARSLIFRGSLEVEADIVFQLAALSLQASHGDHIDEAATRGLIRKSPILPANVLKDQASMTLCEDQVIEHYIKTRGQTRGQAIVNYMTIVESMPTYGVHYFEVLDKRGSLWWLGLSCRGIAQYEAVDRKTPMRVFQWKQLENLYFRDKKFSIEVHDAKRVVQTLSSFNLYEDSNNSSSQLNKNDKDLAEAISESTTQVSLSRRSYNPGNIHVYVWFGKTQALTKCIWQSAISQHQFYLDRKQAKMRPFQLRTLKEIARDLTRSSLSLSSNSSSCSMSNLSQSLSESTLALTASKVSLPGVTSSLVVASQQQQPSQPQQQSDEQIEEAKRLKVEMLAALKARREALDAKLKEKNALLKELCIKEGELTGELPPEIPLNPGEPVPTIRKRVGTEFKLSEDLLKGDSKDNLRANLELELEIQNKITAAAHKLVNDPRAPKSVRKQRKSSYQQSLKRLQELEAKLNQMKLKRAASSSSNKQMMMAPPPKQRLGVSVPEDLDHDDLDQTQADDEVDATLSPTRSCPASPRKNLASASAASVMLPENSSSLQNSPHRKSGYIGPNSIYKSTYRNKQFPTFAAGSHSNSPSTGSVLGIDASVGLPLSPQALMSSSGSAASSSGVNLAAGCSSPYRSKYEVPNLQLDSPVGLYNCPQQRTSQAFSSMDDLDALASKSSQKVQLHSQQQSTSSKPPYPTSPIVRRNSANQVMMNHKYVLGQAREVMARVEAATAAVLNDKAKESRSIPAVAENVESNAQTTSATDLHHHSHQQSSGSVKYREIGKTIADNISHNLHNTEEYPPHQMTSRGCRDSESLASYPLPPSHRTTSTTLLPGQTYPEQPAKPITSLQDVFYHRENFRMALEPKKSEKGESPPPPPLYPKKYHDVVEQRRRSGLDRPTAVAVPAVIHPVTTGTSNDTVQVPLESPAVDRRSKPKMEDDSSSLNGLATTTAIAPSSVVNNHEQVQQAAQQPMKYVPYLETTKPFEMSDFYKYSTKYKKAGSGSAGGHNGSESSSTGSSSSNLDNNNKPPELPAKNSPAKGSGPPPLPPPPPKKMSSLNSSESVSKDLGDAFSSEMLQWYKNSQQQPQPHAGGHRKKMTNTEKVSSSTDNKPATLV